MNLTPVPDFDEYFYARARGATTTPRSEGRPSPHRDRARLLVGREASLHVLRAESLRHGVSRQGADEVSPARELSRRYGLFDFNAIDNIIAPEYTERCLEGSPRPKRHPSALRSAGRLHARTAHADAAGGLISIQPGIESLSTHVLRLMRKHSTGMRNLELIKWCTYYGINNLYNILVGFPGETADDYRHPMRHDRQIPHWQPPYAIARARADRGSPMFTEPGRMASHSSSRPTATGISFPRGRFDLNRISYYFDHDGPGMLPDDEYDGIFHAVALWQQRWRNGSRPILSYRKSCSSILIEDTRGSAVHARLLRWACGALRVLHGCETHQAIETQFADSDWLPAGPRRIPRSRSDGRAGRAISQSCPAENAYI